ncbi:MAG: uridine diphosphate-N-acetylglucosamine-binding protein YvcK [Clostridia bacterium]|nr:uridine diphosphate-N-acetylglucosamine-binding protein YvcK [Clostridia bacterium]
MRGILHWFKSSTKMKRWIFLILVGIILACYGLAEILVLKEVSFMEIGKIVVIFVIGFIAIVLGLIGSNKRTLEVLIESTDNRMENKKNINVKSLIYNKNVYDQGPNIVVLGGGTGLNTVLSGLKNYTNNITAIVTVSDYGEGVTNSRKELEMLPMGDIKDSMIALSSRGNEIEQLFNYEFKDGRLSGLSFSDIYFRAMNDVNKDFTKAIMKSNEVLNIVGKVLPVTLDEMQICAELDNGYVVNSKSKITQMVTEKITKINRIFINPSNCRPAPGVVEAIQNADCIVIGPGSLYTNVIPNLLINGVTRALKESTAMKIYVSNIMTEAGQTDNYSVSDHLNAIISHCGQGVVDYCIYDTGEIVPEFIKKYNMEGQDLVEQDIEKTKGIKFLQRDLSNVTEGYIRHDSNLVAKSIIELICDDLKYQDKQNDPQYLMLNNKLREDKRISKMKKHAKKQNMKNANSKKAKSGLKSKSKFSNKYSERIASIKESDAKIKKKMEANKKPKASGLINKQNKLQTENKEEFSNASRLDNIIEARLNSARKREPSLNLKPKNETKKSSPKENLKSSKPEKKATTKSKETIATTKSKETIVTSPRKKTPQEIREEMLRKLEGR